MERAVLPEMGDGERLVVEGWHNMIDIEEITRQVVGSELERYYPVESFGRPVDVSKLDREAAYHNLTNVFFALAYLFSRNQVSLEVVRYAEAWLNKNLTGARFEFDNERVWWKLVMD